jgi:hypothetical protein
MNFATQYPHSYSHKPTTRSSVISLSQKTNVLTGDTKSVLGRLNKNIMGNSVGDYWSPELTDSKMEKKDDKLQSMS